MKIRWAHRTVNRCECWAHRCECWAHRCPPPPIGNTDETLCANNIQIMFRGFYFPVRSAIAIGAGYIGALLVLADYK
jgi:hypothetical protein